MLQTKNLLLYRPLSLTELKVWYVFAYRYSVIVKNGVAKIDGKLYA